MAVAVATSSCDDESTAPLEPTGPGGAGGAGGQPMGCDGCDAGEPICVDGEYCAAECPDFRAACNLDGPGEPPGCCNAGAQCCPGTPGGPGLCRGANAPCPAICGDGATVCEFGTYCQEDVGLGTWSCVDSCDIARVCGGECCPLGSRCDNGECLLADMTVDTGTVAATAAVHRAFFEQGACEIIEGCVAAPGDRLLLRFSLSSPNIGQGDLFLGDPALDPNLFQFSSCHGHYHFQSYAAYRLLDLQMNEVATGHKQAFCLLDLLPGPNGDPRPTYDCSYQGISAGWADVYDAGLPCQWVDVTDLQPGDYLLEISLNAEHVLAEADYDNNLVVVPVNIPVDSCPQGCKPFDAMCCDPADPCGWGADGSCDCHGQQAWDNADCASCYGGDPDCVPPASQCIGCTPWDPNGNCCGPVDMCGWTNDGYCDCGGMTSWDTSDCQVCQGQCP
jgi:hypothetical protein